jgi:hypothetical protein
MKNLLRKMFQVIFVLHAFLDILPDSNSFVIERGELFIAVRTPATV